jgi:hypothetical protein
MAWSIAEGSAKLRGMMSRNRFKQILSVWHYYRDFRIIEKLRDTMGRIKKE